MASAIAYSLPKMEMKTYSGSANPTMYARSAPKVLTANTTGMSVADMMKLVDTQPAEQNIPWGWIAFGMAAIGVYLFMK